MIQGCLRTRARGKLQDKMMLKWTEGEKKLPNMRQLIKRGVIRGCNLIT